MENLTKKILVLTLTLLFIAFLLIALTSGLRKQKQQEKEMQITYVIVDSPSSYYPDYGRYLTPTSGRYYSSGDYENRYRHNYYENYPEKPEIIKDFSYYGKKVTRKEFLGNYVVEYQIYVLNKGNIGNYFTVIFNFKTQEGFEYSEAITQYLGAGEKKEFLYKDVQFERTEILSWNYKVERV